MTDPRGRALPDLGSAIALADSRRRALRADLAPRRVRLPLRYWRQQAHFTTPAEEAIARKAVEGGTSPMGRIMTRFNVGPNELAHHLGADVALVEQLLAEPRRAPLVMLDAEDALALTDAAAELGRQGAADVLRPQTGPAADPAACASIARRASTWRPPPGSSMACSGHLRSGRPTAPSPRRHRVPQGRTPRGGRPAAWHADRGRTLAGSPRGWHPGRVPGRIGLGGSAAARTSRSVPQTACVPSSSVSPTIPLTWACRPSPTSTRSRPGHVQRS